MKYRITPLNIVSIIAVGFALYYGFNPGPMGFGMALAVMLTFAALFGFLIDYIIQIASKNYLRSFLIQSILLITLAILYIREERTKTLIIPDRLASKYVVIVYGVDSAPELPIGLVKWDYRVRVPEDGLLLTSTKMESDLPQTKMETYSGSKLKTKTSHLSWGRFSTDKIECNGKVYDFQSWLVDKHCCMYSSNEQIALKKQLQKELCNLKKAL